MEIPAIHDDPRAAPAWGGLEDHASANASLHLNDLLDADGARFEKFSIELDGLVADYSRNRLTEETIDLLLKLASERQLDQWVECLFEGGSVNNTEGRPALHTALRQESGQPIIVDGQDVLPGIRRERERFLDFARGLQAGTILGHRGKAFRTVVNIGIGGSDLGPRMVTQVLGRDRHPDIDLRFVSNIDGAELAQVLDEAIPDTTLFIISSKSFGTQETRLNAEAARRWLREKLPADEVANHLVAVTAKPEAAADFGVLPERCFRIWDWVGGRYSLWSAVGLSIAIGTSADVFVEMLDGAVQMDRHFRSAPVDRNLPVILGLIGIWNQNFLGAGAHVILPYDERLARLPAYLQQLDMESNGKGVRRDGTPVEYSTGVPAWGGLGSDAQHSFAQLLHQGVPEITVDYIAPARGAGPLENQHQLGLVNLLAQAEARARGQARDAVESRMKQSGYADDDIARLAPHLVHQGNRSSNILLLDGLSARRLGMLLALYEHKIFVQSVIWGINAFDQWGVELGKVLARDFGETITNGAAASGSPGLPAILHRWRQI